MFVIAKSLKGAEYMYKAESAHKVSERSAKTILQVLNDKRWDLKENEVWAIHEVWNIDNAYYYAQDQKFTIRNGIVKKRYC